MSANVHKILSCSLVEGSWEPSATNALTASELSKCLKMSEPIRKRRKPFDASLIIAKFCERLDAQAAGFTKSPAPELS